MTLFINNTILQLHNNNRRKINKEKEEIKREVHKPEDLESS